MNHYTARQLVDGLWDYTVNGRATGYCAPYLDLADCKYMVVPESDIIRNRSFKDKYHSCGHKTEKEACECYKEYVLDNRLRISKSSNSQHKCEKCGVWTDGYVTVGSCCLLTLCEEHQTRETISEFYSVNESWES